jgi:hypothetical protein
LDIGLPRAWKYGAAASIAKIGGKAWLSKTTATTVNATSYWARLFTRELRLIGQTAATTKATAPGTMRLPGLWTISWCASRHGIRAASR